VTTEADAKPRPVLPRFPEMDTQLFWDATRDHELRYQVCEACGEVVFYPRSHCTKCTSVDLKWQVSAGEGTIYTYSIIRRTHHASFRHMVPYVIAWVDLDEKFRLLTHIVDVDLDDPERSPNIGSRVAVHWIDHDTLSLPAFRLVDGVEPGTDG